MSTPDSSGALSVVAAVIATAGALLQLGWKIQAERDAREKVKREEREERDRVALEARVKVLEERDHAQELVLVRQGGDLEHVREAIDDVRGMLRRVLGLDGSSPSLPPPHPPRPRSQQP